MNWQEKNIIKTLLAGGHIVHLGPSGIRLRDKNINPIQKVTAIRFRRLKPLMKKTKKGLWVISAGEVLKLRSNSYIKQQYKLLKKNED